MSRYFILALLVIAGHAVRTARAADAKQPNVVFIFIDDQGYYDLSCYGAKVVKTPRIDELAGNGVRFTDFYSAASICSPSRAGVVTGCYPRRTGNEVWVHRPDSEEGLPDDILTMGELFKAIALVAPDWPEPNGFA